MWKSDKCKGQQLHTDIASACATIPVTGHFHWTAANATLAAFQIESLQSPKLDSNGGYVGMLGFSRETEPIGCRMSIYSILF